MRRLGWRGSGSRAWQVPFHWSRLERREAPGPGGNAVAGSGGSRMNASGDDGPRELLRLRPHTRYAVARDAARVMPVHRMGAAMAELKIKLNIKYKDVYDGKHPQLIKSLIELPTFEYDKTVKIQDADVKAKDIEREFLHSAHGIFATISYVVDAILKENKISSKGTVTPSALKPVQAQITKELIPYRKSLTKLLEGTIDELAGNEAAEEAYNPKDDKATPKFLGTLTKIGEVNAVFRDLGTALAAGLDQARTLTGPKAPPLPAKGAKDPPWIALIEEVEKAQKAFGDGIKDVQRSMKAKPPNLQAQKAASKESREQKERREAMNELVELLGKIPKRLDEIAGIIADATTACGSLLGALRAGRADFRLSQWPSVPDISPSWTKLETLIKTINKQIKAVEKLAS
ncbi:hypothetical protein [Siccirubricoccus deserti]|uniref:Uncharacterized protein n=1 Tax=Siccirubricoccus deserti TaxID=2013562 RepID=A0A9X0UBE6_9PROT|nr:hypothetical protein [Siccirubricoccus deserti]MBC4013749.1 hypothetical protein [Siccirubricoccus deserti]